MVVASLTARLLALLLAALLLVETSGVAGAFEVDPIVHCCCGDHDAGEPCGCPTCPGHGKLRLRSAASAPLPKDVTIRACIGRGKFASLVAHATLHPVLRFVLRS